jgi:hypothetical protein
MHHRDRVGISKKAEFWVTLHAFLCAAFALCIGFVAKHYFAADGLVEYSVFGIAWFTSFFWTKGFFYRKGGVP